MNCRMRELCFSSRSASCLLVFFPFVWESSCLNTNLLDVRIRGMTVRMNAYCWSSMLKPIEKKPIIDTLCWGTYPAASWSVSFWTNLSQTSCKVVAVGKLAIVQIYGEQEVLTLFGFIVWIRCLRVTFPALDHPYPSCNSFWRECCRELLKNFRVLSTHQYCLHEVPRE